MFHFIGEVFAAFMSNNSAVKIIYISNNKKNPFITYMKRKSHFKIKKKLPQKAKSNFFENYWTVRIDVDSLII